MRNLLIASFLITSVMVVTGCGGGGGGGSVTSVPSTTTVSGKVADGYLIGAEVFLDKNGNYQWDSGEPKGTTDSNGAYSLNVPVQDAGKYPVVARAIAGITIDKDTNAPIANSYYMCAPAGYSGFISPFSTLVREKMAANPNMTLTEALTQLRNQMGLPVGVDMMADYMSGSLSGLHAVHYQTMHTAAQQIVGLMAGQSRMVMNGAVMNNFRYRGMIAIINSNMPGIAANVLNGQGINSTFMTNMMNALSAQLGSMPMTGGFMNYSGMFRNMTSNRYFWSNTGAPMTPMSGGMI